MLPSMNVFVCAKQIPDPNAAGKFDPVTKRLVREGVDVVLDPVSYTHLTLPTKA